MTATLAADLLELQARFETWRTNRKYLREPILRSTPLGGESEWALFAFVTIVCRKHTIIHLLLLTPSGSLKALCSIFRNGCWRYEFRSRRRGNFRHWRIRLMGWRSVLRRWNLFLTPLITKLQISTNSGAEAC